MSGTLYIVATPIGNLEDITLRAIRILNEVNVIIAEDTRHTLKLLNHLKIKKPLISYYKQNEIEKSEILIEKLKNGENIALVSDAGTPGISDPGEVIIKNALKQNISVVPIPGAVAFVNALIASGISTSEFIFQGFLPVNKKEKEDILTNLQKENKTLIFYEAPHKMQKTLEAIYKILGDRNIVLAKEITKIHEKFIRCKVSEILEKEMEFKGEFVIIVEGSKVNQNDEKLKELQKLSLDEHYAMYEKQGLDKKEIIKKIAKDRGVSKNEVYRHFV
ncbi:MAG: 16S rRNA (cytidine(1402)-2'-O)-methyltransferase [Oscillospiraceae bacterium]|nr:16S rRNA (cytidine(1402)-2'-O)-methyltransferase [Oscillospiraceae bacterium]